MLTYVLVAENYQTGREKFVSASHDLNQAIEAFNDSDTAGHDMATLYALKDGHKISMVYYLPPKGLTLETIMSSEYIRKL